jgi:hypothetical protein
MLSDAARWLAFKEQLEDHVAFRRIIDAKMKNAYSPREVLPMSSEEIARRTSVYQGIIDDMIYDANASLKRLQKISWGWSLDSEEVRVAVVHNPPHPPKEAA